MSGVKHIEGLDCDYEVSSDGRVYSLSGWRGQPRRELVQSLNSHGYPRVSVMRGGKKTSLLVHSLVANAFLLERPSSAHEVRHLDGDRTNNVASNLAWGTRAENAADRARHGRTSSGEAHSLAIRSSNQANGTRAFRAAQREARATGDRPQKGGAL